MVVVFGLGLCGKVDCVPGRLHVATQFLQLFFVPYLAISSYVVVENDAKTAPVPISLKSVLLAWARFFLLLAAIVALGYTCLNLKRPWSELAFPGIFGIVALSAAALLVFISPRASYRRALQLGMVVGIPPETIAADFKREPLDAATLDSLRQEIALKDDRIPPRARFFLSVFLFLVGAGITYAMARWLLKEGSIDYVSLPMLIVGLILFFGGFGVLADWGMRIGNWVRAGVVVGVLLAIPLLPMLSRWYWRPMEEETWQRYLAAISRDVQNSKSIDGILGVADTEYSRYTYDSSHSIIPLHVRRPEYWLLDSLVSPSIYVSREKFARLAESGDDRLRAVLRLRETLQPLTGDQGRRARAERFNKYFPLIQKGEWPAEIR
jgi:hypothetical protein